MYRKSHWLNLPLAVSHRGLKHRRSTDLRSSAAGRNLNQPSLLRLLTDSGLRLIALPELPRSSTNAERSSHPMAAAAPKDLREPASVIRPLHPSTEDVVRENGKTFAAEAR